MIANFMHQLDRLKDAQIAGKTFLDMFVSVYLENISILLIRQSKDLPHQYIWTSSSLLRPE